MFGTDYHMPDDCVNRSANHAMWARMHTVSVLQEMRHWLSRIPLRLAEAQTLLCLRSGSCPSGNFRPEGERLTIRPSAPSLKHVPRVPLFVTLVFSG